MSRGRCRPCAGSSPLTRGKLRHGHATAPIAGLIPAHAGKTLGACDFAGYKRAHPRSRGENVVIRMGDEAVRGSSPLTRGKRVRGRRTRMDTVAHPRSRGENWAGTSVMGSTSGSSPLTRGKPLRTTRALAPCGLIPAHAGKTGQRRGPGGRAPAHPRSRGENSTSWSTPSGDMGSSPLTRGKHGVYAGRPPRNGLIPAHAGKTDTGGVSTYGHGAHPRSRGENLLMPAHMPSMKGSSPLTRGKLHAGGVGDRRSGLIPAHAGKTDEEPRRGGAQRAHPRSRGENCRA